MAEATLASWTWWVSLQAAIAWWLFATRDSPLPLVLRRVVPALLGKRQRANIVARGRAAGAPKCESDEELVDKWVEQWLCFSINHGIGGLTMLLGMRAGNAGLWRIGLTVETGEDLLHFGQIGAAALFGVGPCTAWGLARVLPMALHHTLGLLAGIPAYFLLADWPDVQLFGLIMLGAPVPGMGLEALLATFDQSTPGLPFFLSTLLSCGNFVFWIYCRFAPRQMAVGCAWLLPAHRAEGARFEVPREGLLIGRKEGCGLRLAGPTISAIQCKIWYKSADDAFEVEDQSSNGTYVNGQQMSRNQRIELCEGDIIQLTKRWHVNPALQFRFTRVACAEAEKSRTVRPLAELACPDEAGDVTEKLTEAWRWLSSAKERARTVATALAQLNSAPEPPRAPEGLRAASEEMAQEAEHAQLTAQRGVLQAELASLRGVLEQRRGELGTAEASAARSRSERARLEEELHAALGGLAQLRGQHEALHIGLEEAAREAQAAELVLGPAGALAESLEGSRKVALAEAEAEQSAVASLAKLGETRQASVGLLRGLAQGLAEDLRAQASALCDCVEALGDARPGADAPTQAAAAVATVWAFTTPPPLQPVPPPTQPAVVPPAAHVAEEEVEEELVQSQPVVPELPTPAVLLCASPGKENALPVAHATAADNAPEEAPLKRPRLWAHVASGAVSRSVGVPKHSRSGAIVIDDLGSQG